MPLIEDVPGDDGLAGHDVVMLQQDTPSLDGLVAATITTGSVRLGGWGCWCVRTAGPARRGDGSVREVTCPVGCVFALGACCQFSASALSGGVRSAMDTARCRGRTHATGHPASGLAAAWAGRAGRRPADARRRCRAWPVPVAALQGRLAVSALCRRRTRTGRMAPRVGRRRLHSRRHGVAGVSCAGAAPNGYRRCGATGASPIR